ncbi:MAG TPA: hypothetical protein EYQ24_10215 [Bacteroidetes bacterium]|nr:hypothetical protein [Bacteroidota bacterium]HIL57212.1 hypothetical protein [Rhodothermales bacterium]
MTVKSISGPTIPEALADARRIFGAEVVLLQAEPAAPGQPARVTVAFDADASARPSAAPATEAAPAPRVYGYGARRAAPAPPSAPEPIASPPAEAAAPVVPEPNARQRRVREVLRALERQAQTPALEIGLPDAPASERPSCVTSAPTPSPRPFAASASRPRVLVFVGPAGAGKTSLMLRLGLQPRTLGARQAAALVVPTEPVPLVDPIDVLWHRGIPAAEIREAADVAPACDLLAGADLLLVDTPPLPLNEADARTHLHRLGTLLAPLGEVEVVFVLDATRSADTLSADRVRAFGLAPDALALTRTEEAAPGAARAWADRLPWPLRLLSSGPDLGDLQAPPAGARQTAPPVARLDPCLT